MEKEEFALESFKNIQELIRFIDQKSSAVLVVAGIVFTGYTEFSKDLVIVSIRNTSFFGSLSFLSGLTLLISLLVVVWISIFKVLKPRLAENYSENECSLFYFEHISKLGKDKALKKFQKISNDTMLKYIIDQKFEISRILEKKTKYLSDSFYWLFISIVSLVIFILTSFVI